MAEILFSYLFIAVLVAFASLWTVTRTFNEYDWHKDKGDIWFHVIVNVFFWPLSLFGWLKRGKPNLSEWLRPISNRAVNNFETAKAFQALSQCGAYVRFTPSQMSILEECHGEFVFASEVVEHLLEERLKESPELRCNDERELLAWIQQRNNASMGIVDISSIWTNVFCLIEMGIHLNRVQVRCKLCNCDITVHQLRDQSSVACGHSYKRYTCPRGHVLVAHESARLMLSRN
ncbi:TPA: hypothetical protein P0E37_004594 [Vibrio campbellii]|nr:hypothetical protein [Vibrio campbellii]